VFERFQESSEKERFGFSEIQKKLPHRALSGHPPSIPGRVSALTGTIVGGSLIGRLEATESSSSRSCLAVPARLLAADRYGVDQGCRRSPGPQNFYTLLDVGIRPSAYHLLLSSPFQVAASIVGTASS